MESNYEQIGDKLIKVHKGGVIATKENDIIARGESFLRVFNQLGSDGWHMCGQSTQKKLYFFERPIDD
jgi:hypothetical protein